MPTTPPPPPLYVRAALLSGTPQDAKAKAYADVQARAELAAHPKITHERYLSVWRSAYDAYVRSVGRRAA